MMSCCFFVSLSSLCFATDEDGRAVENFCNTLFKCTFVLVKLMLIDIAIFGYILI